MSDPVIIGLGLSAQGLFGLRFLVQWLYSERAGRSVVPPVFWVLSCTGSVLLLIYACCRRDPVFVAAQSISLVVYCRNVQLLLHPPAPREPGDPAEEFRIPVLTWVLIAALAGSSIAASFVAFRQPTTLPAGILVLGLIGQLIFGCRFAVQLAESERQGRSVMPAGFWYCSLCGSALLLIYAIVRRDPVFILAHAPNILIYSRNLILLRREAAQAHPPATARRKRRRDALPARILAPISQLLSFTILMGVRRAFLCVPRRMRLRMGSFLGLCAYHLRVRRNVVTKNLEHVGMQIPGKDNKQLIRAIFASTGRMLVDALTFSRHHMPPVVVENDELLRRSEDDACGVLLVGAHYGNWELLIHVLGERFPGLGVVAKPMRNRWLERWLKKQRLAPGVELLHPRHAMRRSVHLIREGNALAYLIDQYAGRRGTTVPFLGRDASTVRSTAGLAVLTGCRVLAGYACVDTEGVYRVMVREIPNPPVSGSERSATISRLLTQQNDILSSWIRECPENWFGWFHRRFKDSITY